METEAEYQHILQQCHWQLLERLPTFRHTFSHFHLDIHPIVVTNNSTSTLAVKNVAETVAKYGQTVQNNNEYWYDLADFSPAKIGLATPVKNLLMQLKAIFNVRSNEE